MAANLEFDERVHPKDESTPYAAGREAGVANRTRGGGAPVKALFMRRGLCDIVDAMWNCPHPSLHMYSP